MAELNLIPYEIKKKKQKNLKSKDKIAYIILFALLIFCGIYFPLQTKVKLMATEASLKIELDENKGIIAENKRLINEVAVINGYLAKVEGLSVAKVNANDEIRGIEKYIPADVKLLNLTYAKGMISINAKANNYNSLCVFVANLQTSKEYKEAKLNNINAGENSEFTCSIMIGSKEVAK